MKQTLTKRKLDITIISDKDRVNTESDKLEQK